MPSWQLLLCARTTLEFLPTSGAALEAGTEAGCSPCFSVLEAFSAVLFTPQGKVTLAGWLATNLLFLPGCKFCDLMAELKEGKTLQGGWTVPLCFPNVIPLPCTASSFLKETRCFKARLQCGIQAVGKAQGLYV